MYNTIYIFPRFTCSIGEKLKDKFSDKNKNIFPKTKILLVQLKEGFRSRQ